MKKQLLALAMGLIMAGGFNAFAQAQAPGPQQLSARPTPDGKGPGPGGCALPDPDRKCDKPGCDKQKGSCPAMKGIELNAEQKAKVEKLSKKQQEKAEKAREKMQKDMQKEREQFAKEMKKILTPEQYAQFQANLKDARPSDKPGCKMKEGCMKQKPGCCQKPDCKKTDCKKPDCKKEDCKKQGCKSQEEKGRLERLKEKKAAGDKPVKVVNPDQPANTEIEIIKAPEQPLLY